MADTNPPTRRRWFQFGIGAMLFGTAAVAVFLITVAPAWEQRDAVNTIVQLGGRVGYDESTANKRPWLRRIVGEDFVRRVVVVHLSGPLFQQSQNLIVALGKIRRLRSVEFLTVDSAALSDDHLAIVAGIRTLKALEISGAIDDTGMAPLVHLSELARLDCNVGTVNRELNNQTSFDFTNVSIEQVVEYFAVRHNFGVKFDYKALSAAGPNWQNITITDAANGITLAQALQRLLGPHHIGVQINSGKLVVTTQPNAEEAHKGIAALQRQLPKLRDVSVGW